MKTVLISGSFDPVTRGHADLITRAAQLFDHVDVVIFENSHKKTLFSLDERLAFLQKVCAVCGDNITAATSCGTVAGYAAEHGIHAIVKGVRNANDLLYEQEMATLNRLAGGPETILLPTEPTLSYVSSSAVREFLRHALPAEKLLPAVIYDDVLAAYRKKA
ncbi:MAG: pantetheine-phosphate adenylyltransferase [Clostridia bacterium]|nr:pantetheine-phosphate adenylyltransferase [Clostridia bacterium]